MEASGLSHFGPPTPPNKTASAPAAESRTEGKRGDPCLSMDIPPTSPYSSLKLCPNILPTASRELTPWAVTSVPIPSPGNTEISKSTFGFPPGPSSGFFHPSAQGPFRAPVYKQCQPPSNNSFRHGFTLDTFMGL